ncbi:MAG: hypothetical protein R3B45_09580 [Bdellovibrionota bacterium]
MKQLEGLISVLLDKNAREDERDDAAMDLSSYNEPEVESALFQAIGNHDTPKVVIASCGESLAEIWLRNETFDKKKSLNHSKNLRYPKQKP